VAHERRSLDTQRVEHAAHDVGHHLHRMHLAQNLRDTVSGHVYRDHTHLGRQQRDEVVPYVHRFEVAVDQHHTPLAAARVGHVQRRAVGHNKLLFHHKSVVWMRKFSNFPAMRVSAAAL